MYDEIKRRSTTHELLDYAELSRKFGCPVEIAIFGRVGMDKFFRMSVTSGHSNPLVSIDGGPIAYCVRIDGVWKIDREYYLVNSEKEEIDTEIREFIINSRL